MPNNYFLSVHTTPHFSMTLLPRALSPSRGSVTLLIPKKEPNPEEGTVYFAAGVLADHLDREVNVKDFDVSLILVFRDKAAHAKYQQHPRHLKFIDEHQSLWSGVRVFDSYIPVSGKKGNPAR